MKTPLTLQEAWDLLGSNNDEPADWAECDGYQVVQDAAILYLKYKPNISREFTHGLAAGFRMGVLAMQQGKEGN